MLFLELLFFCFFFTNKLLLCKAAPLKSGKKNKDLKIGITWDVPVSLNLFQALAGLGIRQQQLNITCTGSICLGNLVRRRQIIGVNCQCVYTSLCVQG